VPPADEEPTIDVPLKKGTKAVKISHIKIVGGESDAVAYRQAITVAGRLIGGGLWDGASQIRFDDVYQRCWTSFGWIRCGRMLKTTGMSPTMKRAHSALHCV